jgi:NAD(P)-dependent dehydrogenase (short-subunit alcohol dehydrogenase family)
MGPVILVTGSTDGIGRATAIELARQGVAAGMPDRIRRIAVEDNA